MITTEPQMSNCVLEEMLDSESEIQQPMSSRVLRATVVEILDSGEIVVSVPSASSATFPCDVLLGTPALSLKVGDPVVALSPSVKEERGVVLGLIVPYTPPSEQQGSVAKQFEVVASEAISLKCGESSLEMRKDGKVLVKGKDVVSLAKRVQRIKGGTVAIN